MQQAPNNFLQVLMSLLILFVVAGGILWIAQMIRRRIHRRLGIEVDTSEEE